ncbi:MAG: aspartate aminotransferase family protein [Roseiflexus sp.]|nr:aspartate aminotransferase family protein [Roseiflexus sp.]MCS7291035.1 aspartate aminotransferase family protein [Roseiflexus sp.]MDW8234227.1 aspartate aminotransferase family protein [Roseiflexaceae bacterium]
MTQSISESIISTEAAYTSGVYPKRQVAIVRGEGALLWDADGRVYIDCVGGQGAANLGHAHPAVVAAIREQAERLISCPEIFYNDQRAAYLAELAAALPFSARIFLCNSGAEAIEGAIKIARLKTGRTGIIAAVRGFHGRTMGALSATFEPKYREPFMPLVPDFTHVPYNNIAALDAAVTDRTAAVILEPVQGEGGVLPAAPGYLADVERICRERGALLIIDEVQTGFGRTGTLFAIERHGIAPALLCLAKSIAGGLPMGAIAINATLGPLPPASHGTTFGGSPLVCAAARAALRVMRDEDLPRQAAEKGAYALERLTALRLPRIRAVRGQGLLIGVELKERVQPFLVALMERGVLALPAGPNVLRLLPPLVITYEQIDAVIAAIAEVLA